MQKEPLRSATASSCTRRSHPRQRLIVNAEVARLLKQNRYDPVSRTLTFSEAEAESYQRQIGLWTKYFSTPEKDGGLPHDYISDPAQLRELTSFFAWAAWASVTDRPGRNHSYTNNFPYDPAVGNVPTSGAVLWSALSLITLLGATAAVLFAFGRFDFLGWRRRRGHVHPKMLPGVATPSQRATIKYFTVVALLFLAQALVGGGTAHYRASAGSFYGINLVGDFAEPNPAHLASAARNFLDRGIVRRGRTIPGAIDWRP